MPSVEVGVQTDLTSTQKRDNSFTWVVGDGSSNSSGQQHKTQFHDDAPVYGDGTSNSSGQQQQMQLQDEASVDGAESANSSGQQQQQMQLQDEASWPPLPAGYFTSVGRAHGRWGFPSKSWKYAVNYLTTVDHEGLSRSWVQPRMQLWLEDRRLADKLAYVQRGEMPLENNPWFVKYTYRPNEHIPPLHNSEIVYHGTSFPVLARILHTNRLHESNGSLHLGMETHVNFSCVYTASTMVHALGYAWPSSALKDNLYYKVLFQCETSSLDVIKRHKGEVLVRGCHLVIRNVFLYYNCAIEKGAPKCADSQLAQDLELLPFVPGQSLNFSPLRSSTWYSQEVPDP